MGMHLTRLCSEVETAGKLKTCPLDQCKTLLAAGEFYWFIIYHSISSSSVHRKEVRSKFTGNKQEVTVDPLRFGGEPFVIEGLR